MHVPPTTPDQEEERRLQPRMEDERPSTSAGAEVERRAPKLSEEKRRKSLLPVEKRR